MQAQLPASGAGLQTISNKPSGEAGAAGLRATLSIKALNLESNFMSVIPSWPKRSERKGWQELVSSLSSKKIEVLRLPCQGLAPEPQKVLWPYRGLLSAEAKDKGGFPINSCIPV